MVRGCFDAVVAIGEEDEEEEEEDVVVVVEADSLRINTYIDTIYLSF